MTIRGGEVYLQQHHPKQMMGEGEQMTTNSNVDFFMLPPCRDNLIPHIKCVTHRLAILKRAEQPIFWCSVYDSFDSGQGWQKVAFVMMEPVWSSGPIFPTSLTDLLQKITEEMKEDEEEEPDIDYNDRFDDDYRYRN